MNHVIVDCDTGETSIVPLTDEEFAAQQQQQAAEQLAEQARQDAETAARTQRQSDADILMAALPTQEARDALARLLGL